MDELNYEITHHLETHKEQWQRCEGVDEDENCDAILIRNPAATPGKYKLKEGSADCSDFLDWDPWVSYGPELFTNMRANLRFPINNE